MLKKFIRWKFLKITSSAELSTGWILGGVKFQNFVLSKCLEGYVYFFGMLKGFPHDVFAHFQEFHVSLLFFPKTQGRGAGNVSLQPSLEMDFH